MIHGLSIYVFVASALADDVVLTVPGADDSALQHLDALKAGPPRVVHPSDLIPPQGSPYTTGGARIVAACAGPPTTRADVKKELDAAESSVSYVDYDAALSALQRGKNALGCMSEPADPVAVARMFFLRGFVESAQGDAAGASASFAAAKGWQPALQWDASLPPDAKPAFDASGATKAHVTVLPPTAQLDGRSASAVEVPLGTHYVQIADKTYTVVVDADATLFLPAFIPDDAATWAADADRRPALAALLTTGLGAGTPVWIDDGTHMWRGTAGSTDFTPVDIPTKKPPSASKAGPIAMTAAGGGLALVGGGLALWSHGSAVGARDQADAAAEADDYERWQQSNRRYNNLRGVYAATGAIAGVGLAVAAGGAAWTFTATPNGVWIEVRR